MIDWKLISLEFGDNHIMYDDGHPVREQIKSMSEEIVNLRESIGLMEKNYRISTDLLTIAHKIQIEHIKRQLKKND